MNSMVILEKIFLEGGRGADYFDCGENYDIVLDYDPGDGDILANNCEEVIRT